MANNLTEEQNKEVLEMQVVTKVAVIAQMCKIIEGCTQRGAFKPDEMTYIGGMYDSLSGVLKQSVEKVQEKYKSKDKTEDKTEETKSETTNETSVEITETEVEGETEN